MSLFKEIHKFSNKIALIVPDQGFIKYSKLISESVKLTKNLEKRSTVFLLGRNDYEWIIGYLGFIKKKIIIILIDPDVNLNNLKQLIKDYKPKYIFKKKNTYTLNSCKTLLNYFNYELGEFDKYIIQKNYKELAILLTTSGTSGKNKFVRISYENLIANTRSIIKYLNIKNTDRLITTLQPSYSYGLSMLNTHLYNGASIVLNNYSIIEKNFWKLLKDNKVKTFGGVPYTYELLEKIKFHKFNITSLRYLTQAGGKLDNKIFQKINDVCEKNNIQFISMYGQTEASPRMSFLPSRFNKDKINCIGKAIPNGKFKIIDRNNKNISKINISGELVYLGKNVSLGYATSYLDLKKVDENKGILFTGDIAKRDSDNFYYITGRKKRFLKIFGNRINLDEIEQNLNNVGFKCVCGGNDKKIIIYFTSKKKQIKLMNYASKLINLNKNYIEFSYIEKINRTSRGKIEYKKLKK
jgi:long-chain acyl-CoA synthetase